ncbi:hypothetical protein TD95_000076 [Thielaviopsis punctulata]|uniref:Uracil-DNA glycosylase n=1 Tax=Thielaviopsis punctulata TaxID=72032 RepID=A0A0F4Z6N5_9PEZI|nr:hypothetical protein TD95_000076 [Thielaviopsis punctulata]
MSNNLKRKASNVLDGDDYKKPRPNASITSYFAVKTPPCSAPASAANSFNSHCMKTPAAFVSSSFNKDKWVASLSEERRNLLELEIETLHESWLALLKDELVTEEFLNLKRFLNREIANGRKVFPPREDIYSWSRYTPFHNVKVVIVGQDPYHNFNQAHGLAFSVRPPTMTPPSLRNIYVCLTNDYPDFVTPPKNNGLLTPWAERGVLLLNTCLTVRAHEANSHANRGWERFTQRIIDLVAQKRQHGVVFMAWGTPAGKRVMKIDQKRHLVLKAVHPSPLSASRGFFTCGHFRKANEWLVSRYGPQGEIDWSLVPKKPVTVSLAPPQTTVPVDVSTPKQQIAPERADDTDKTTTSEENDETPSFQENKKMPAGKQEAVTTAGNNQPAEAKTAADGEDAENDEHKGDSKASAAVDTAPASAATSEAKSIKIDQSEKENIAHKQELSV